MGSGIHGTADGNGAADDTGKNADAEEAVKNNVRIFGKGQHGNHVKSRNHCVHHVSGEPLHDEIGHAAIRVYDARALAKEGQVSGK